MALRYDLSLPAPMVMAAATGRAAARAVALAEDAGVPVVRDEGVAMALVPFDVGDLVPPEYWEIVAKVLIFINGRRTASPSGGAPGNVGT